MAGEREHDPSERRDLWWASPTIELAETIRVRPEGGFETVHGGWFDTFQIAYESWGTLNADRDNVVLVVHPLASDPHAAGAYLEQPDGWWDALIGPGRVLDTDRFFVVCPNLLGGCYGTTGPRFPAGEDDRPFLGQFPLLTPLDLMRAQRLFLEALGVNRVHRVVGPSMGAMVAWEWAIEGGDFVEQAVVVAAPLRTTAYQIGLNWLQRRGIELDLSEDEVVAKAGQMIARGVGMLSYRSQPGLEEKFGREWFKKPGSTLDQRGMYNIESWLRHHGKRMVKRFDPYTYILFSRAMDLHDVGRDRGGLVSALEKVRCDALVVGISSDQLYTADEVRLGVDILHHLGRPATYAEIRSPHGHDAFLLETEQLTEILATTPARGPRMLPASDRNVRTVRVGVLGAGRVAANLMRLLEEERERLGQSGLRFDVVAVAEIDAAKELDPVFEGMAILQDPDALPSRNGLDVVVDLTRGTSSRAVVEQCLRRGIPVVTPNKPVVRAHGRELERIASEHGTRLAFRGSIASAGPLLYSLERPLERERVRGMQAILSTACGLVLEQVESGGTVEEGVQQAIARGVAEPDPALDLSGWVAAQKLLILMAHAERRRYSTQAVPVRGIDDLDPALVRAAGGVGLKVRLIGIYLAGRDGEAPAAVVRPCAVAGDGTFGGARGDHNVVVLEVDPGVELIFVERGEGAFPVARAVLGDLVGLFDAERSWAGRYPMAEVEPREVRFARFLGLSDGKTVFLDAEREGAVPLLDSVVHQTG